MQEAAADDEDLAREVRFPDGAEEAHEIALERLVIERPRELARARVVREVVLIHPSLASAMIRYSYAVGESAGTSGSETAQRTRRANGASAASGKKRASFEG